MIKHRQQKHTLLQLEQTVMKLNVIFRTSFHDKYVIDKLDLINPDPNKNYEIQKKNLNNLINKCFPVKFNGKKTPKKIMDDFGNTKICKS